MKELIETLKNAPNEGTDSPYWLIIDPSGRNIKTRIDDIAHCITGPFFSRQDAETYLKAKRYNFSSRAGVWCFSGYHSRKYKEFYRNVEKTNEVTLKSFGEEGSTSISESAVLTEELIKDASLRGSESKE